MNILHTANLGQVEGFDILFEAVAPLHNPVMSKGEADAISSNSLVCFTPHVSAMLNGYVVGMVQCATEIMADYDLYYSHPTFKEVVQQAVIDAQLTVEAYNAQD